MLCLVTTEGGADFAVEGFGVDLACVFGVATLLVSAFSSDESELSFDDEEESLLDDESESEFLLEVDPPLTLPGLALMPVKKTEYALGPPPVSLLAKSIRIHSAMLTSLLAVALTLHATRRIRSLAIGRWKFVPTKAVGSIPCSADRFALFIASFLTP